MPNDLEGYLSRHYQTSTPELVKLADDLIAAILTPDHPNRSLYRDMLQSVLRMANTQHDRWDAKIALQALKELENAFAMLIPFKRDFKATVFGSARTSKDHPAYQMAKDLGASLAHENWMVITGAGDGIMAAAHEGAGLNHSLGFNITLPFEQKANAIVEGTSHLIPFHFFFLRKLFFVKEADAIVLCPGGFGTLDEAMEVITLVQTGKSPLVPIIFLDTPNGQYWNKLWSFFEDGILNDGYISPADLKLIDIAQSPRDCIDLIKAFYRNYHSSRWANGDFIMRLQRPLPDEVVTNLTHEFSDILDAGVFQQALQSHQDFVDIEFRCMPRLFFKFNGRDQGRLRELINIINHY